MKPQTCLQQQREMAAAKYPVSNWTPEHPTGGTEIALAGLQGRLDKELERAYLRTDGLSGEEWEIVRHLVATPKKPLIIWVHCHFDAPAYEWMRDPDLVAKVAAVVFVSEWQRRSFLDYFPWLLPARCLVLRNAVEVPDAMRIWQPGKIRRVGYTSAPERGLDILLDAWERLQPQDAELHIWSDNRLYGPTYGKPQAVMDRAAQLDNVYFRGILPNHALRSELLEVDYLVYPCRRRETSCLAVIEALVAGCRVITSDLAALPQTGGGFARVFPHRADPGEMVELTTIALREELANPWGGHPGRAVEQQLWARSIYGWDFRVHEWRNLISGLS